LYFCELGIGHHTVCISESNYVAAADHVIFFSRHLSSFLIVTSVSFLFLILFLNFHCCRSLW